MAKRKKKYNNKCLENTHANRKTNQTVHPSTPEPSTSEYRNKKESLHVKQIANWQRKAVMALVDGELKEQGRTVTADPGQENLSPSGLVLCFSPAPPPLLPPPHPAVPVLTATSHTLHLPSGSGREQKGQPADSPLAGTALVGSCWPMGILTHLM